MSMSKRHFEELAKSLKDLKADLDKATVDGFGNSINGSEVNFAYERHVRRVAALCRVENPEFQFGRFYVAAGVNVS